VVSRIDNTNFSFRHRADVMSPIGAIESVIYSLLSRIEQYATEKDWKNQEGLTHLDQDYQQRVLDLNNFIIQLHLNELELPTEEIDELKQRANILTNKLKEMNFYLTQLHANPESAAKLIALRHKIFIDNSTQEVKVTVIRQMLAKLEHPGLRQWLEEQFSNPNWYGWCYEPAQIEKTLKLINSLMRNNEVNYQQLQAYLLDHHATFLPLTRACSALLQPKLELTYMAEQLDQIKEYFKQLSQHIMTVGNAFNVMEKKLEPLVIRPLNSLQAIFDDYQQNLQPRALQVRDINDQLKYLQELAQSLESHHAKLLPTLDTSQFQGELGKADYEETIVMELTTLRDALLNSYARLESAIAALITQGSALAKTLSQDLSLKPPVMSDSNLNQQAMAESDSIPAFFDHQFNPKDLIGNNIPDHIDTSVPLAQNPNQSRMDALIRASRRFAERPQTRS
jgi:hypothetical protein